MSLRDFSTQDLVDELERREKIFGDKPLPMELPDWSPLYDAVVRYIADVEASVDNENKMSLDKWTHYLMESAVEAVYGEDVWKWVNPILSAR